MENWRIFEQNATEFLEGFFDNLYFKNNGQSDSTVGDIEVYDENKGHLFNIEAKLSPSQAGQIVVHIENREFVFSDKSKNDAIPSTHQLINHLNQNYPRYSDVQQGSIKIEVGEQILFAFIKEQYQSKNSPWIIASKQKSNLNSSNLCLVPIEEIDRYFDVSASLRRKKSGSRALSQKLLDRAEELITEFCENPVIEKEGKKTYLTADIGSQKPYLGDGIYLSKQSENLYEIRQLGTTNNPNIMFELTLKDEFEFKNEEFIKSVCP